MLVEDARWVAWEPGSLCLSTKQQQRVLPKLSCQSALASYLWLRSNFDIPSIHIFDIEKALMPWILCLFLICGSCYCSACVLRYSSASAILWDECTLPSRKHTWPLGLLKMNKQKTPQRHHYQKNPNEQQQMENT